MDTKKKLIDVEDNFELAEQMIKPQPIRTSSDSTAKVKSKDLTRKKLCFNLADDAISLIGEVVRLLDDGTGKNRVYASQVIEFSCKHVCKMILDDPQGKAGELATLLIANPSPKTSKKI